MVRELSATTQEITLKALANSNPRVCFETLVSKVAQEILRNPDKSGLRLRRNECGIPGLPKRNPGLELANAFSVRVLIHPGLELANAVSVRVLIHPGLELANAVSVLQLTICDADNCETTILPSATAQTKSPLPRKARGFY